MGFFGDALVFPINTFALPYAVQCCLHARLSSASVSERYKNHLAGCRCWLLFAVQPCGLSLCYFRFFPGNLSFIISGTTGWTVVHSLS